MIRKATKADVYALEKLANRAYRGETSTKGWTSEAHLIAGTVRTDKNDIEQKITHVNSCFIVFEKEEIIIGMVYVENRSHSMYLGMLAVEPNLQNAGVGKQLMAAAEKQAFYWNCPKIEMIVLPMRTELLNWYHTLGYSNLNKTIPFEVPEKFGKPLQPLHFITLGKTIELNF